MTKTYKQIKREIRELEALKENGTVQTGYTLKEIARTVGHGEYEGTGRYELVPTYGAANVNTKIEKRINALKNLKAYKEGKAIEDTKAEAKKREAKAKRYRKELAELKARKAYLEAWLAENE